MSKMKEVMKEVKDLHKELCELGETIGVPYSSFLEAKGIKCVVCDKTKNIITCPNGHHQCGRCMLNRISSIYDEGRYAFNDDNAQKCFTCRASMGDKLISFHCPVYDKMLKLVCIRGSTYVKLLRQGVPKNIAKMISNDSQVLATVFD